MYQVDINDVVRTYDFGDGNGFLFCLFEAVSNSLYCCVNNQDIKITVQLKREYRANELIKDNENFITAVSVTDNGTGFTNDNFAKFTKTIYLKNIKNDFRDDAKKSLEYYSDEILNHLYIFLYFLLEQKKEFEIKIIDL